MKWFKHLAVSHLDSSLSVALDKFGGDAYAVYWIVMEMIATEVEGPDSCCRSVHSIKRWAKTCRVSTKKFQKIVEFFAEFGDFSTKLSGELLEISAPILLNLKDEYTRKSGQKSGDVRRVSGPNRREENRREEIKNKTPLPISPKTEAPLPSVAEGVRGEEKVPLLTSPPGPHSGESGPRTIDSSSRDSRNSGFSNDFLTFWRVYPKKKGKMAAYKSWLKTKGLRPDIDTVVRAVNRQKQSPDWLKDNGQFIPHPATWLTQGRWDDEVKDERDGWTEQEKQIGWKIGLPTAN